MKHNELHSFSELLVLCSHEIIHSFQPMVAYGHSRGVTPFDAPLWHTTVKGSHLLSHTVRGAVLRKSTNQ